MFVYYLLIEPSTVLEGYKPAGTLGRGWDAEPSLKIFYLFSLSECLSSLLLPILSAKFLFLYVINGSIFEWLPRLSDAEFIQVLDSTIGIFKMLNMDATIKQVLYIIDEVERSSVIRSYLEIQFTQLQYIAERDFWDNSL